MDALIFTRRAESPSGESELAKNIIGALPSIYDSVRLIQVQVSPMDEFNNSFHQKSFMRTPLNPDDRVDIHFINYSITNHQALSLLHSIRQLLKGRTYVYNFGLITGNDPFTALKNLVGILTTSLMRGVTFLTTSLKLSSCFRYLNPSLHYTPAPIKIPSKITRETQSNQFTLLYLGQAYYIRFPYDQILRAISLAHKMGVPVKLIVRFSSRHSDERLINNAHYLSRLMKLERFVDMELCDLTEDEKEFLYSKSDAFLYPAIKPSATDPPVVILEALAREVSVISTPMHSLQNVMGPDLIHFIDRSDLSTSLASQIKWLALNPALRKRQALLARIFVEKRHSPAVFARVLSRIVRDTS